MILVGLMLCVLFHLNDEKQVFFVEQIQLNKSLGRIVCFHFTEFNNMVSVETINQYITSSNYWQYSPKIFSGMKKLLILKYRRIILLKKVPIFNLSFLC